ncbi:MAG: polysaccharide deacetylase family protein [Deltaproteobacteria bacterium]|nr:polysaccharide deacetylase family protein [Deltaproteobacteria bacterium]
MEDQRRIRDREDDPLEDAREQMMPGNSIVKGMVARLAATRFVREALAEKADLKAMRAKPTPRIWVGLGLMGFSYIIGWPAVGLLAWISYHLREPLIVVVGGPATYGLSYLVFLAGFYLAGVHYAQILLRWATQRLMERLTGAAPPECAPQCLPPPGFPLSVAAGMKSGVVRRRKWEALSPAFLAGMMAFLASSLMLFIRPALVIVPLGVFVLLCLVAPFFPGVGFFLPVISRRKTGRRAVALTFDDGPDPNVTPRLLDLLRRHGVQATFFVAGASAERHPELIRGILSRGHTLGNHSYHHDPLLMLRSRAKLQEEVARTQDVLSAFAVRPLTFRPPVGITNPRLPGVLGALGMYCVTFSCRAFDRGNRRIARLAAIILKKVRPGDILLLHDVSPRGGEGIEEWLAEMEQIVSGLKLQGYKILPLHELIDRPVMERLSTSESSP